MAYIHPISAKVVHNPYAIPSLDFLL